MFNVTRHTRVPKILSSRRANGKDVPRADAQPPMRTPPPLPPEKTATTPPARTPQTPQVRAARLCPAGRGKPARQTRATLRSGEAQRSRRRRELRKHRHHAPPANKTPRARAEALFVPAARQQAPRQSSVPRPRRAWLPDRLPKGPRGSPPRAARAPLP